MAVRKKRFGRALMIRMNENLWRQLDTECGSGSLTKARWVRTAIRHCLHCEQAKLELSQQVYSRVMKWSEPR